MESGMVTLLTIKHQIVILPFSGKWSFALDQEYSEILPSLHGGDKGLLSSTEVYVESESRSSSEVTGFL